MFRCIGVLLVALGIAIPCCIAAELALKGSHPDTRAWAPGTPRADVERELGQLVSSRPTGEGGRIDTYEYKARSPSPSPAPYRGLFPWEGWAGFHVFMSILTLGAWEFIGVPIELSRGETRRVSITYGPDDRVVASEFEPGNSSAAKGGQP